MSGEGGVARWKVAEALFAGFAGPGVPDLARAGSGWLPDALMPVRRSGRVQITAFAPQPEGIDRRTGKARLVEAWRG